MLRPRRRWAVVNVDDPCGRGSPTELRAAGLTYGITDPPTSRRSSLTFSLEGLHFRVATPRGRCRMRSPLVGRPNVYNILAAAATGVALDLPFNAIERAIERLEGVPGRFQIVSSDTDGVTVVVDYAHTDDALRNLLETARPLASGRLITVFGCGGDRDRTQTAAHGRRWPRAERSHRRHLGQPAQRGPARRSSRRFSAASPRTPGAIAGRGCSRSSIAARRLPRRSTRPGQATSCSSRARATRSTRSSATRCFRSMTCVVAREALAGVVRSRGHERGRMRLRGRHRLAPLGRRAPTGEPGERADRTGRRGSTRAPSSAGDLFVRASGGNGSTAPTSSGRQSTRGIVAAMDAARLSKGRRPLRGRRHRGRRRVAALQALAQGVRRRVGHQAWWRSPAAPARRRRRK